MLQRGGGGKGWLTASKVNLDTVPMGILDVRDL